MMEPIFLASEWFIHRRIFNALLQVPRGLGLQLGLRHTPGHRLAKHLGGEQKLGEP